MNINTKSSSFITKKPNPNLFDQNPLLEKQTRSILETSESINTPFYKKPPIPPKFLPNPVQELPNEKKKPFLKRGGPIEMKVENSKTLTINSEPFTIKQICSNEIVKNILIYIVILMLCSAITFSIILLEENYS